jgi:Family of unknown function (DUF5681)
MHDYNIPTRFQPGNTLQQRKPARITQMLISALHETVEAEKNGQKIELTKARAITDKLIELAIGGDMTAIKEIFDRVDGKARPVDRDAQADALDGVTIVIERHFVDRDGKPVLLEGAGGS